MMFTHAVPSRQLCRLHFCPTNTSNTSRSTERIDRVSQRVVLLIYAHFRRAVLASLLLHEELGHIGRVGCALCLLGSVIIVLHAPEDKEIQTVDEILQYALQPGMSRHLAPRSANFRRFSHVRFAGHRLVTLCHIPPGADPWQENPPRIHLHMFPRRVRQRNGN